MTHLRAPSPRFRWFLRARAAALLATGLLVASIASVAPAARVTAGSPPDPRPSSPPAAALYAGSGSQRTIALTFDDGWDARRCLAIADTLEAYGIPATFFPNGVYVAQATDAWRSIGARFPVGNHTYHHMDLRQLDDKKIAKELDRNRRVIEAATGRPMAPFLRPPYGAWNPRVARVAGALGYTHIVLWSNTDADTAPHITPRGAAMSALRGDPGGIVLLHCGPEVTPEVLPIIIERYACDGFRFVTVGELLSGSPGHKAKVDCPPLPLPAKNHPHRPTGSPEPSPVASPMPSPGPSLAPDDRPLLQRVADTLASGLARVVTLLDTWFPVGSPPPSGTP